MPLIKREVEPTELSRGAIAPGIRNELECVTNNTLANVVRQVRIIFRRYVQNQFVIIDLY